MKSAENDKPKVLQVRMTEKEIEQAKEKAAASGLNLSQVVRKLLADYVKDPQGRLIFG